MGPERRRESNRNGRAEIQGSASQCQKFHRCSPLIRKQVLLSSHQPLRSQLYWVLSPGRYRPGQAGEARERQCHCGGLAREAGLLALETWLLCVGGLLSPQCLVLFISDLFHSSLIKDFRGKFQWFHLCNLKNIREGKGILELGILSLDLTRGTAWYGAVVCKGAFAPGDIRQSRRQF